MATARSVTWLHISDLHVETSPDDDTRVGRGQRRCFEAIERDIADFRANASAQKPVAAPDLLLLSGDIVKRGDRPAMFTRAHEWVDRVCDAAAIDRSRVFVIPGNHDLDRPSVPNEHRRLLNLSRWDSSKFKETVDFIWDSQPVLQAVGKKFASYRAFARKYAQVQQGVLNSWRSLIEMNGLEIELVGLNSVWTGGTDTLDRPGMPVVGEPQRDWIDDLAAGEKPDLTIVLQHNPTTYLNSIDSQDHAAWLDGRDAVVFCGHLHLSDIAERRSIRGRHFELTGGALYPGYQGERRYSFGTIRVEPEIRRFSIALRASEPGSRHFAKDTTRYPGAPDGEVSFEQGLARPNIGAEISDQTLVIDLERSVLRYDDNNFEVRIEKTYSNPTDKPWTHIDALVLVNAFPDDPRQSRELYRRHPLDLDDIGFWATRDGERIDWIVLNDFDSSKELQLVLGEPDGGLQPGATTTLTYGFHIIRDFWGPYFERHIRYPTKRIQCELDFPRGLVRRLSLVRNRLITAVDMTDDLARDTKNGRNIYRWDLKRPPLRSRYRFMWTYR